MSAPRIIRVVYLYIFSVVGLGLAVIGALGMLDLALKAAAQNLALLLVGIPLYLCHWRAVRREAQA